MYIRRFWIDVMFWVRMYSCVHWDILCTHGRSGQNLIVFWQKLQESSGPAAACDQAHRSFYHPVYWDVLRTHGRSGHNLICFWQKLQASSGPAAACDQAHPSFSHRALGHPTYARKIGSQPHCLLAEVAGNKRPSSSVRPSTSFGLPPCGDQILSGENWPTSLRLFEFQLEKLPCWLLGNIGLFEPNYRIFTSRHCCDIIYQNSRFPCCVDLT